jgi:hypothetical protein
VHEAVTPELYLLTMVLGFPIVLLVIAMIAAYLARDADDRLLEDERARVLKRELALDSEDSDWLLAAINRHRRARGLGDRTVEDILSRR